MFGSKINWQSKTTWAGLTGILTSVGAGMTKQCDPVTALQGVVAGAGLIFLRAGVGAEANKGAGNATAYK